MKGAAIFFSQGIRSLVLRMVRYFVGLSLLLLVACGSSAQHQEVRSKLALVREQIRIMDAELAPTDDIGNQLLEQSSENLKRVERLLIEDEIQQALTMLDSITKRLAAHSQETSSDPVESASFYSHFGLVKFSEDGLNYTDISEVQQIDQIRSIKTSTRSGVRLNFAGSVSLELGANGQIDFTNSGKDTVDAVLVRGVLVANQSKPVPFLQVTLGGYKARVSSHPFEAEFSNQDLVKRRYIAVYMGTVSGTNFDGETHEIKVDQALWWAISGPEPISLVQRPTLDNPAPNETIGIVEATGKAKPHFRWHANTPTPRFQLQVSDQPSFFTRIYDNANLISNGEFVELEPGLVYFRVRGLTDEGVPGPFTETYKLNISANQLVAQVGEKEYVPPKGPEITNVQIEIIGDTAIVTGQTDKPTNKISVNGIGAVMMENGKFRAIVTFTGFGIQDVRVVGLDPATGGETTVVRKVNVGD